MTSQQATPPLCMQGFDLNKLAKCADNNTTILTIETNGDATSKDWLGVSCAVVAQ